MTTPILRTTLVAAGLVAAGASFTPARAQQVQCSSEVGKTTAVTNAAGHVIEAKYQSRPPTNLQPLLATTIVSEGGCLVAHLSGQVRVTDNYVAFQVRVNGIPLRGQHPRNPPDPAGAGSSFEPVKSQRLEGRATRILYVAPQERSPLEIVRNYELELKKNGFETLFTCAGPQCGLQEGWLAEFYLYPLGKRLSQTPPAGSGRPPGQVSENALASPVGQRYLAAKRSRPEGDVYVSVYVATNRATYHKETQDHPVIVLDVVDAVPIETGMVTIDAAAMAKDLSTTGHVALYGIHFDTDKADPKSESQPTLQEIAKLLKQDASLKLYIVGHTDNVGLFDYNVGLSERRAAAVVKELTAKHGIAAARLKPAGVGMLSPVAPNDGDEGRAKNRRVELMKQ
jgi:OmpA-OmpF porin, OOP family